ncbi:30S ribosomal protein S20 [Patescibacteria group bacterium]|nr:30S ribosomal protein S20 [Patescibacteria group bacterium]
MPIKKSALKALRQSEKKRIRHNKVKAGLNWLRRQFLKAINAKDKKGAQSLYLKLQKALDKAVQKGAIKKNTASRSKSRLFKKVNKLN